MTAVGWALQRLTSASPYQLAVNLGPLFTWWDRLAGTWVSPDVPAPTLYGPAAPVPANPVAVELRGWIALVAGRRPAPARV